MNDPKTFCNVFWTAWYPLMRWTWSANEHVAFGNSVVGIHVNWSNFVSRISVCAFNSHVSSLCSLDWKETTHQPCNTSWCRDMTKNRAQRLKGGIQNRVGKEGAEIQLLMVRLSEQVPIYTPTSNCSINNLACSDAVPRHTWYPEARTAYKIFNRIHVCWENSHEILSTQ